VVLSKDLLACMDAQKHDDRQRLSQLVQRAVRVVIGTENPTICGMVLDGTNGEQRVARMP